MTKEEKELEKCYCKSIEIKFNEATTELWSEDQIVAFAKFLGRMRGIDGMLYKEEYADGDFVMRLC